MTDKTLLLAKELASEAKCPLSVIIQSIERYESTQEQKEATKEKGNEARSNKILKQAKEKEARARFYESLDDYDMYELPKSIMNAYESASREEW